MLQSLQVSVQMTEIVLQNKGNCKNTVQYCSTYKIQQFKYKISYIHNSSEYFKITNKKISKIERQAKLLLQHTK